MGKHNLDANFDVLGLIALALGFISVLFSFNLSLPDIIMSVGIFLVIIATYLYFSFRSVLNHQAIEIKKLKEKLNIYKDISDLRTKVEILFDNFKMKKKGQSIPIDLLIRIIQILAIIFAGYIILKSLGVNFS